MYSKSREAFGIIVSTKSAAFISRFVGEVRGSAGLRSLLAALDRDMPAPVLSNGHHSTKDCYFQYSQLIYNPPLCILQLMPTNALHPFAIFSCVLSLMPTNPTPVQIHCHCCTDLRLHFHTTSETEGRYFIRQLSAPNDSREMAHI